MFCRDALHASCVMQLMVYREETHAKETHGNASLHGQQIKVAEGLI